MKSKLQKNKVQELKIVEPINCKKCKQQNYKCRIVKA